MGTYATSTVTQQALINAAGELAAQVGFPNVSTRAIATRAGENVGSIHYHFGGKQQLFEAVVRQAIQRFVDFPAREVLEPYESILDTPEGQSRAIRALVHRNITLLFDRTVPSWYSRVLYQVLRSMGPLQVLLENELIHPTRDVMSAFFRRIRPDLNDEDALMHDLIMNTPLYFHADYMDAILRHLGRDVCTDEYFQKMEDAIVLQTQLLFGLPSDRPVLVGGVR